MSITTKTGDDGITSLADGTRVPKDNIEIEICGTIDELNNLLGVANTHIDNDIKKTILIIQHKLFCIGSLLALPIEFPLENCPIVAEEDINFLEKEIDLLESILPTQTEFILPGGSKGSAYTSLACTVCRRAERKLTSYVREIKDTGFKKKIDSTKISLKYLNRLSDLLFLISRQENISNKIDEIKWDKKI